MSKATTTTKAKATTVKKFKPRRNTGKGMTGYGDKENASFSVWLNLPIGAYAIAHRWPGTIEEGDDRDIMVRCRKKVYLDRLRQQFLPELGKDVGKDGKGTDYGHRAYCTADQLAKAMARMALSIDSTSFKEHALDDDLHNVYMSMWSSLVKLDDNSPYNGKGWSAGGTGWWQQPNAHHTPKPADCLRMKYHWFDKKEGNATCVDCGAQRTRTHMGTTAAKDKYTYTYPPGAVVLHGKNGGPLPPNQVRRVPGGKVPLDGDTKPAFPAGVTPDLLPGPASATPVAHGLGFPTRASDTGPVPSGNPNECLILQDHWWTGPGTAICRDCGAGRYVDAESGDFRFTHPLGSVMLTDADGYTIDDPHVVTDEDAPDTEVGMGDEADPAGREGSEDEATAATSTELEVYVTP